MDIASFYNIGSLINVFLILGGVIVCCIMVRNGVAKELSTVQNTTIATMREEVSSLREQIKDVRSENKRLEFIVLTICEAMKKRGFEINIDGSMVYIRDQKNGIDTSVHIRGDIE